MGAAFHIKLDRNDLAWTLRCGGELDTASAGRLEEAFDLCEQMRPDTVHIDGTDLTFIDSAGVTALIRCAHRCKEDGVGFSVVVSDQVRETLSRAGFAERLLLGRTGA